MIYKQLLAPVISIETDAPALRVAADLADRFDAHAYALVVSVGLGSAFAPVESPLSDVLADVAAGAESMAVRAHADIVAWMKAHAPSLRLRETTIEAAAGEDQIVADARLSDLVIACRSSSYVQARQALIDDVLFKSGRPLLILPPEVTTAPDWRRILIAWNATTEAMRAVIGAMPLLRAADEVRVVTIDATPSAAGHGEAPGAELAHYLARHGAHADVDNRDGAGRPPARAIADAALDMNASLIVMGAYGHSRLRERIVGGVTRTMLRQSRTPLLVAR